MEDIESHPIPQDVTGFQFKIIGDMTIKQFAYILGSVFLGWICYQLPIITFVKLPLAIFIGVSGPALAFLPIEGRPLDVMIYNFIKAFFKPTRFVYRKTGGHSWLSTITVQSPIAYKENVPAQKVSQPIKTTPLILTHGSVSVDNAGNISPPLPLPNIQTQTPAVLTQAKSPYIVSMYSSPIVSQAAPQAEPPKQNPKPVIKIQSDKDDSLKKRVRELEKDLEATKNEKLELEKKQLEKAYPQQASMYIERQLQEVIMQKEELTNQLISLQQKLDLQNRKVFTPSIATGSTSGKTVKTQNVKQIPKGMEKNIGSPITPGFPNIITGIIKDPRGNPLGNILVEVKDKEGNPVRAFKTNGLGQFISATALANGEYTIIFEDPKGQNKFDAIGFKAIGEIILPLEIASIDEREELRKSLFRES